MVDASVVRVAAKGNEAGAFHSVEVGDGGAFDADGFGDVARGAEGSFSWTRISHSRSEPPAATEVSWSKAWLTSFAVRVKCRPSGSWSDAGTSWHLLPLPGDVSVAGVGGRGDGSTVVDARRGDPERCGGAAGEEGGCGDEGPAGGAGVGEPTEA
jgi:hypothetical protein